MRYAESLPSSRWFTWPTLLGAVAAVAFAAWVLRSDASREDGGAIAGPVLASTGVALAIVVRVFGVLRIEVDATALRARFGPIGPTLRAAEIGEARVVPYRWLAYGGWGLRFGRQGGRMSRAYSAPFVRTGVVVDTVGGRRYHLTSQRPEELVAAVNRLAEEARVA